MQCNVFLRVAAAVQRQSRLAVKAAESVNPVDIPESSFHRCSGFTDSMQLPDSLLPEAGERAEGPILGLYRLMNPYTD